MASGLKFPGGSGNFSPEAIIGAALSSRAVANPLRRPIYQPPCSEVYDQPQKTRPGIGMNYYQPQLRGYRWNSN